MIKLKINGREIAAEPGLTVLEAAQAHGIKIPNLCAAKGLSSYGGCRLCLVEIKGRRGYVPACCTPVEENLEVTTETPQLRDLRRLTLELILSEHPHACLICTEKKNCEEYKSTIRKVGEVTGCVLCPENGQCRLQELVEELKIEKVRFPASYRNLEVLREDPFFDRNYNLCILCARCVRACAEVRGASAISVVFRGPQAVIGTAMDRPLLDSGCQMCGACVDVCPTGALTERALKGAGLPAETRSTICPLCSVGCTIEAGLRDGQIITSYPIEGQPVNDGQACVKGRFIVRDVVHSPKRSLRPMLRRHGELEAVTWDEALDEVARRLTGDHLPGSGLVVSSQLSLEDQYIALKFSREVFGAEPLLDSAGRLPLLACRSVLRENGVYAPLNFELGSLSNAGFILAAGADPALSQPVLWVNVLNAVRKGAKLLVLNSRESVLDRWATLSLRIKPGTGPAVLGCFSRWLFDRSSKDRWASFPGYEGLRSALEKMSQDGLLSSSGLTAEELQAAGRLLQESRAGYFLCGSGFLDDHDENQVIPMLWNIAQFVDARLIPLAVENNERGVAELWPEAGANDPSFGRILQGAEKGRVNSLYVAGAFPQPGEDRPDFLIVQECYRGPAGRSADVVLPAAAWAETDGTFVNIEGRIQKFKPLVDLPGESRPDWWIFCRLAEKLGRQGFGFRNAAEIAEEMSKELPALHEASSHHPRKGKSCYIREEKIAPARFISPEAPERARPIPGAGGRPDAADYYRGLDLCEEVRGLRRLREKSRPGDRKEEG
ncbi:MAG: fdhF 2 [Candidatus Aminicenantes bacterium]|nr:fdhF 2 [Candidatus Aminicenantes bacterium]